MQKGILIGFLLQSALFSYVSCNFGKALYFLQRPSFQGAPPDEGQGYEDQTQVDNAGARKVLFGHYSAILENRPNPTPKFSLAGLIKNLLPAFGRSKKKGKSTKLEIKKKAQLTHIVDLYRRNLFLTIQSAKELTSGSKTDEYQNQLESCQATLKQCDAQGDLEVRCGVECLSKGNDIFPELVDPIAKLAETFCAPIDTIFDKHFENKRGVIHPNMRKFWTFLKSFNATKKPMDDVAAQGVNALVPLIIDNIRTSMMPFRLLNLKLEEELQAEMILNPRSIVSNMVSNNLCQLVDDADVSEDLMDVLYRDPTLVDATLGGLTTYNLVAKYLPGRFQINFAASAEAIRLMTGSTCGLIHYSKSGVVPNCDQIGGFPVTGIPLPDIPDMPKLNQECLQGNNDVNSDKEEEESTTQPQEDASTPSSGKVKRGIGSAKKVAFVEKDGVGMRIRKEGLIGNDRVKRTLVVGQGRQR